MIEITALLNIGSREKADWPRLREGESAVVDEKVGEAMIAAGVAIMRKPTAASVKAAPAAKAKSDEEKG